MLEKQMQYKKCCTLHTALSLGAVRAKLSAQVDVAICAGDVYI